MRIDVLTLFPPIFTSYLGESLVGKAIERRRVEVHVHDIRDWSADRHHRVDDRPFGGGPGMILMAEPVVAAAEAVQQLASPPARDPPDPPRPAAGSASSRALGEGTSADVALWAVRGI